MALRPGTHPTKRVPDTVAELRRILAEYPGDTKIHVVRILTGYGVCRDGKYGHNDRSAATLLAFTPPEKKDKND